MLSTFRKFGKIVRKKRLLGTVAATTTLSGTYYLAQAPVIHESNDILSNVGAGIRFLRSVAVGAVITVDYHISTIGLSEDHPNYEPRMSNLHRRSATRIMNACMVNGGTYIKIGQGLACFSHIMPKEYTEVLTQLQDKCLIRSNGELYELFKQDFGKTPEEMYNTFDMEPIAAASLAQVYRATTKENEPVAVKVQYIDLQKRFKSDVKTIHFLLGFVGLFHPNFDFDWVVQEVIDALKEELDFVKEGKNSERCACELSNLKYVHVPTVNWKLSSTRVLVTEFIEGIKINNTEELERNGISLADVDTKLMTAFGQQIFQTGFVHGDPHAGNVLVRKVNNKAQLVIIDHGLYQILTEKDRISLGYFFKALVMADQKGMKKHAMALGVNDYAVLAEILTQRPLKSRNFKLTTRVTEDELKYMTDFAKNRFDVIMGTLKEMPSSLLLVIRNLNTLRAIAHDHGDPINKFSVLARTATKAIFNENDTILSKIKVTPLKIYFELQLFLGNLWVWFQKSWLEMLYALGRSPDATELIANLG